MSKSFPWVRCGALLALCGALAGSAVAAEIELNFDFSQAHAFLGVGTQVWMKGDKGGAGEGATGGAKKRRPAPPQASGDDDGDASTRLLRELNARFVRVSMIPKITFSQLRPGMSVEQVRAMLEENDTSAQRDRVEAFNRRMRALDIRPVLIFWRMPEPWVEIRKQRAGSKSQANYARPERIGDYVNLIVAQMSWLQRHGVQPAAVELTNEPQGAWDTQYTREDYATLVLKARAAMDAHGLQAWPIAGPGTGIRNFDHFVGALQSSGAVRSLGYISAHVYQSPQMLADPATPGVASFLGRGKFGPILITEFGVKKHNEDDDQAQSDLDVESPEYALAAAAESVLLLGHGAGGLIYWQLQDFSWSKKPHGLLSETGQRRPVAEALKALFGAVPAGAKVVGTGRPRAELPAVALQSGGKTYMMLVNRGAQAQQIVARFQGGPANCKEGVARVDAWNAARADPRTAVKASVGADCVLRADLLPGTVATVVLP